MTTYEKNIKILSEYYPKMDELIEQAKKNQDDNTILCEEQANDGSFIIKAKTQQNFCYLNGKRNTTESAQMWYKSLGELQTNATVFVMGLGNSEYLRQLVENTKKKIIIVIYEPSVNIFIYFLEHTPLEEWMKKHLIVFWVEGLDGMDEEHLESFLESTIHYEMLEYNRVLIVPNYEVLFQQKAINFMKVCKKIALRGMVQHNTRITFSDTIIKNILYNMPYLCNGYKTTQLVDVIPRDIPGIVVAAGPSLNKNICDLKEAKGKAFIIAVDTAVKPLLNAGIMPDMFVCIDAEKPLYLIEHKDAKKIPLLTGIEVASDIFDYHTGKKFFYNQGYSLVERVLLQSEYAVGSIESGGSVATNAFSLFHKIGITRIILVGQDLAFTGNKSHADGTFAEKMEEVDTSHYIMVRGNQEEQVPIRLDMKQYLEWYDMYIAGCQKRIKNFRVINATEGGAYIENTEVMSLKEAIKNECTKSVDIKACLDQLKPMLSVEKQRWSIDYMKGLPKEFEETKKLAASIKKQYQKLKKICARSSVDTNEYLAILKKTDKLIKDIEKRSTYQAISMTLVTAQFILRKEAYLEEEDLQKEGKEIARKGILYMENVIKCAELLQEVAENVFVKSGRLETLGISEKNMEK